jgi:TM2 domain-containing membrane protein YozV
MGQRMTETGRPNMRAAKDLPAVPMRQRHEIAFVLLLGPLGAHRFYAGRHISGAVLLIVTLMRWFFSVTFPDGRATIVMDITANEAFQLFTPHLPLSIVIDMVFGFGGPFHHTPQPFDDLRDDWMVFDIGVRIAILALLTFDTVRAARGTRMFELLLAFGPLGLHRLYNGQYRSGSLWFLAAIAHYLLGEWALSDFRRLGDPMSFIFMKSTVVFVASGIDQIRYSIYSVMRGQIFNTVTVYETLFIPFLFFMAKDFWARTAQIMNQFSASAKEASAAP